MKRDSLASSRKAWRLIQSLISRVLTNGRSTMIGGDDFIKLTSEANTSHPFKVSRSGTTVRFQPGLVTSFSSNARPSTWAITDGGGLTLVSLPTYLVIRVTTVANSPYQITNPDQEYYIVPTGGQTVLPLAELGSPTASFGSYNIVAGSVGDSQICVPIAYFTETTTHQLLKKNVSLIPQANHNNLLQFV